MNDGTLGVGSLRCSRVFHRADAEPSIHCKYSHTTRTPFAMINQVITIGAGPGGLASAILLAAAGVRVKIVERLPFVGGRTSSIEAQG